MRTTGATGGGLRALAAVELRPVKLAAMVAVLVASGATSAGEASAGQASAGQASAGQVSAGQVSAGQVSAGQVSAGPAGSGQGPDAAPTPAGGALRHPWLTTSTAGDTVAQRFAPPPGTRRVAVAPGSFGAWLRSLPLHPAGTAVHLHTGARKPGPEHHVAVLDIDVGQRDLQQCADAVMRLRAEYLWSQGRAQEICFRFTSGDAASWRAWSAGRRPRVEGAKVRWSTAAGRASDYRTFRRYLDTVFTYAGSASLARELRAVADPHTVEPGDVFIQGGFPGHAVIVMDVAEGTPQRPGEPAPRWFLLAQSYMPAQQIHILRNPNGATPWYRAHASGALQTPEWQFQYRDLMRFGTSCASAGTTAGR